MAKMPIIKPILSSAFNPTNVDGLIPAASKCLARSSHLPRQLGYVIELFLCRTATVFGWSKTLLSNTAITSSGEPLKPGMFGEASLIIAMFPTAQSASRTRFSNTACSDWDMEENSASGSKFISALNSMAMSSELSSSKENYYGLLRAGRGFHLCCAM